MIIVRPLEEILLTLFYRTFKTYAGSLVRPTATYVHYRARFPFLPPIAPRPTYPTTIITRKTNRNKIPQETRDTKFGIYIM